MFEKRIITKTFLFLWISAALMWTLCACSKDGGTETSRRGAWERSRNVRGTVPSYRGLSAVLSANKRGRRVAGPGIGI